MIKLCWKDARCKRTSCIERTNRATVLHWERQVSERKKAIGSKWCGVVFVHDSTEVIGLLKIVVEEK